MNRFFAVFKFNKNYDEYTIVCDNFRIAKFYDEKMAYETCKFLNERFGYNMPDMQTTFLKDSYN